MKLCKLNNNCFKTKSDKDVTLYSINPEALKALSIDHFKAYTLNEAYKNIDLFKLASDFIKIEMSYIDGRSGYAKQLRYVSVWVLFELLKDNDQFKADLMQLLKAS